MPDILIYGAYGYTGELIAERAVAAGLHPILAGRSEVKLSPLAQRLGLQHRAFPLDDPASLDRGLDGIRVVLHCAGPFIRTSQPMVDACLRRGAHYLDISGEINVFEVLQARHDEASRAGVMLLPGVGMDVVPSDCLAVHAASRVKDPVRLTLAIYAKTRASRGSTHTMLDSIGGTGLVRRKGQLEPVPLMGNKREFDFDRRRVGTTFSMAELSACYHSTGIGDIETYIAVPRVAIALSPLLRWFGRALERPSIRRLVERRIDAAAPGWTPDERAKGRAIVVAEVEDRTGRRTRSTLYLPEPYSFTALAAVLCAKKTLTAPKPGFQTPATAFGPDCVLEIDGVTRKDD